jgi:LCP family protein required for cell wall assembly
MQPSFKEIVIAFVIAVVAGFGIWYVKNISIGSFVTGVVSKPGDVLKNTDGRTNVLLLGMGGVGHSGGDLTDSMLLASFNLSQGTVKMTSIPRDIWVASELAKINSLYHYGSISIPGGGLKKAKEAIGNLFGVPIHYAVALNFQGFVKAIDAIGGIDVEVDHSFDDYKYPIPGKETVEPESDRYEHVRFNQGMSHMDGTAALKFARSRHALGEEGTDFARGLRQEKIILSFRNKLFSAGTIFDSGKLSNLKNSIISSIDTDITSTEQGGFIKLFLSVGSKDNISSFSLIEQFTNPPISQNYGGQWVLLPKSSVAELQTYVQTELAK